jgi:hypothetical protein
VSQAQSDTAANTAIATGDDCDVPTQVEKIR